nr:heme-binding Shp domain-containing protein [Ruminococcus bromii]
MKKLYCTNFFKTLCSMVVMLALVAGITAIPAYAASHGIYTATATPHYRNPLTGKIEDSGGEDSEVLGQSMTESATYTKALVEVDSNGNTYITVRLKLMDNIQNPTFKVDGSSVSASLMQEDYSANTADYRMKVASENSVIRCSMYVVPMGRDVIFFITVSNLNSGSGDFVTSISVNNNKSNNSSNNANSSNNSYSNNNSGNNNNSSYEPAESSNNSSSSKSSDKKNNKNSDKKKSKETTAPTTVKPSTAVPTTIATEPTTDSAQEVNGLQEFDEQGSEVTAPATVDEVQNGSYAVWYVIGIVAVVLVAGFCVWYFGFFRKKKK